MAAADVAVNFTAVNTTLIPKQIVVELAIENGLIDLVNASMNQLDEVNNTIIDSTNETTQDIKTQCKDAEKQLEGVIVELNNTVGSLEIASIENEVI